MPPVELRGDVALKAVAPGVLHKTEAGGVRLNLRGARAAREAATSDERGGAYGDRSGANRLSSCSAWRPPAWRCWSGWSTIPSSVQPSRVARAEHSSNCSKMWPYVWLRSVAQTRPAMVRELRCFPMLDGYRGAVRVRHWCARGRPPAQLVRWLKITHKSPKSIAIPVIVSASGALVVDARIRVAAARAPRPIGARR